jgi:hypothetical protein
VAVAKSEEFSSSRGRSVVRLMFNRLRNMFPGPSGAGPPPGYPSPETWKQVTPRQAARAARSFALLRQRAVPAFQWPLCVDDDDKVKVQSACEVARRLLVLSWVELRAEGRPQAECIGMIEKFGLWPSVSPAEQAFLQAEAPDSAECQRLVWQLEAIWVLLWALGDVETLDWPVKMVDVNRLVRLVMARESDPNFLAGARLRPTAELLDAQDLILRIHWAIREVWLNYGGMIPEGLNWSAKQKRVSVSMSAAVGVVEQRHHALNWLLNFCDPKTWDDVDTST